MMFVPSFAGLLAGALAFAAACSPLNIGTFRTAPKLQSYEDYSLYAESLDGFVQDSLGALTADTLLLHALSDCNVPVAPQNEIRQKAEVYHHAKELMDSIIVLDTHCDFPEYRYYHQEECGGFGDSRSNAQVTLEKMRQGHLGAECMVIYMTPLCNKDQFDPKGIAQAPAVMWDFLDRMEKHFGEFPAQCGIARTSDDARRLHADGKKALFYCLENAYWIGDDISVLEQLRDRGITYITLSHFGDNIICHSSNRSADPSLGLTDFGREVVREMNRLGIVVDLSHTSYGTWRDVLELSTAPVVFTHSGAAAVYENPRNVDDATLRLLAEKGGVIQLHMVRSFMAPKGKRDGVGLNEFMEHLEHLISVAGIDHVGIGLDFDGGGGGTGLDGANDVINITVELLNRGYSDGDIGKILGGNYLRVLDTVQSMATR